MSLQCNIDRRGKRARFIYGLLLLIAGLLLACVWAWPAGSVLRWVIVAACLLSGTFALFEARVGWCAIRALGWRTPM